MVSFSSVTVVEKFDVKGKVRGASVVASSVDEAVVPNVMVLLSNVGHHVTTGLGVVVGRVGLTYKTA